MAKDILFKTVTFGGFKKTDVMEFIENILNEKGELEKKVAANDAQTIQLNNRISQLVSETEDLAKLRNELVDLKSELEGCKNSISDKDDLITELTQRLNSTSVNPDAQAELEALRLENIRLKDEIEKKHDIERQVGAAMLDARAHSEALVEEAKVKAESVTKSVYAAIGETAVKIDDLSTGISDIAHSFTKAVEEVELRIKVLTGNMSKTAQTLIADTVPEDKTIDFIPTVSEYDFSKTQNMAFDEIKKEENE